MRTRPGLLVALGATLALLAAGSSLAETLTSDPELASKVTVRGVHTQGTTVTGEVVNLSPTPLKDVVLLIRNTWNWANEKNPGEDNPGRSTYFTVPAVIPPSGKAIFTHPLPAGPSSDGGGHFTTSVEVVGYTQIGG